METDEFIYTGFFVNDEFHGKGEIRYNDSNTTYAGLFYEGYKHGAGSFSSDNFKYIGNFHYDHFEGDGKLYIFTNDNNFEIESIFCSKY